MSKYGSLTVPLVAGLLYYGAAWSGLNLFALDSGIALLWPPNAVLLGFLLYFPAKRFWPGILTTSLLAEIAADTGIFPVTEMLMFAVVNTLECVLIAVLLKFKGSGSRSRIDWSAPMDVGLFLVVSLLVVTPFCAVLGAFVYKYMLMESLAFTELWRTWWFSDSTGLIVLTPLVLVTIKFLLEPQRSERQGINTHTEPVAVALFSAASFYVVFFVSLDVKDVLGVSPLLLLLMPVWSAVRLTTDFTITLTVLTAAFTALATRSGYGPFYTDMGGGVALLTQEFLSIFMVVVLFVNAFVKQSRNNTQHLKLYKSAMDSSGEGIIITRADDDQPIIYCNRGFENLTGYKTHEVLGRNCRFLNIQEDNFEETKAIKEAVEGYRGVETTLKNRRKNGEFFWNQLSIFPIRNDSGQPTHFVGVQKDVTDAMEQRFQLEKAMLELNDLNANLEKKVLDRTRELQVLNRELRKVAITDHLTGIYNRRKLIELGNAECERCRRRNHQLSILMMDLDHFKQVNDRWGHEAGDLVLRRFADTVSHAIRETDIFGRWGGEEFVLLLTESESVDVNLVANKILDLIGQMRVAYHEDVIPLSVSIGLARFDPLVTDSFQSTILKADKALYKAKHDGRGRVVQYENLKMLYSG